MNRFLAALLAAFCLFSLTACGQEAPAAETPSEPPPAPAPTAEEVAAAQIDARLSTMTVEEKVGQLFFVRCPGDSALTDISTYHLGGYLLFGRDFKDLTANEIIQTLAAYQDAASADTGIPLLLGTDEEGGTVVRVSSNPNLCKQKFRSPQRLLSTGSTEMLLRETHEKDVLLRALGVNVNLAPVCDVSTSPDDFIYPRTTGLGAENTADAIALVTAQMSADGMGSVLKHFPGYGSNADTHTGIAVDSRPLETFRAADFLPFQAGVSAGGAQTAVLVSHNILQAADPDLPASLSPAVHALLREELDFSGVVMTDDLAMDAVAAYAADGSVAVMALQAGNDLVLTTDYRTQIPKVLSALADGTLDTAVVDAACRRVLTWKQALGLL